MQTDFLLDFWHDGRQITTADRDCTAASTVVSVAVNAFPAFAQTAAAAFGLHGLTLKREEFDISGSNAKCSLSLSVDHRQTILSMVGG